MSERLQRFYEFGHFRLDLAEHVLLRDGEPVPLTRKAFDMLVVLVEHDGRLVEKEYLIKTLWPDTFAGDSNLNSNVSTLRKALGREGYGYIETVPTRGYRFKAPSGAGADEGDEVVLERHTRTRVITEEETGVGGQDDLRRQPERAQLPSAVLGRRVSYRGRRGVAIGVFCLLLVGVPAALYFSRPSAERRGEGTQVAGGTPLRSIAVLPFKTIGAGGEEEYLSLGMTDALITRLGNVHRIIVRPTSAVRRYAGPLQDPLAAGREQGVEAVLDGSVQRLGDRVRVTVQLLRARDGALLWSAKFDEQFTDIFAVQDSISSHVVSELLVELNPEEVERFRRRESENIEAYEAYLKGLYFWDKRNKDDYRTAVEYFSKAVEIDPSYARAYVGLGNAKTFLGGHDRASEGQALSEARAAMKRALQLDDSLAEAHAALGLIAMNYDWDWPEAEREFGRAVRLNPNYATAHQWYGEFLACMGRFDEGIGELELAHGLDPLSLVISTDVAKAYMFARRYDEALGRYHRVLEMEPEFDVARGLLAMTYSARGEHEEALRELSKIKKLEGDPMYISYLGYAHGKAGRRAEARDDLVRLRELSKRTYVSPLWMALLCAGGGEKEQAFQWFDRVFDEHPAGGAISLKVAPVWDDLRHDLRFGDLLRRARF